MEANKYWLFQARPDRFDLNEAIREGAEDRWEANQFTGEMRTGDVVYFYQSGPEAGLYGWGVLQSTPYADEGRPDQLWVDVRYRYSFLEKPIPRDEFASQPAWKAHRIFTVRAGTNFRVAPQQANALNELIRAYGFPAPDDVPLKSEGPEPPVSSPTPPELFARLSSASRRVLGYADGIRTSVTAPEIKMAHLVLALFDEGSVRHSFERVDLRREVLVDLMQRSDEPLPDAYDHHQVSAMPELADDVMTALQAAATVATDDTDDQSAMIKPPHVLHGLLGVPDSSAAELLRSRTPPLEAPALSRERLELQNKAVSDVWALEDLLGYEQLAIAITDPILNGETKPPLTVAIQAPWGHGKTTLMRMIRHQLDPRAELEAFKRELRALEGELRSSTKLRFRYEESGLPDLFARLELLGTEGKQRATLRQAVTALRAVLGQPQIEADPSAQGVLRELAERLPQLPGPKPATDGRERSQGTERRAVFAEFFAWFKKELDSHGMLHEDEDQADTRPTVWFNPLYYQEKEQVWAGLAHAILHQLAGRLDSRRRREEFWLRLRVKRLDEDAIRRDLHRLVLERFLPLAVGYLVLAMALIIGLAQRNAHLLWWLPGMAVPGLLAFFHLQLSKWRATKTWTLEGKFETYVQEPDYQDHMGYLHLVDTDIDRALQLLVGRRPIAVFIDDLDRCTPSVVTDVILAINQFISVRDRNVFFFLGMDGQKVADALETLQALPQGEDANGRDEMSFGWRFLEKFINVPFFIPRLSENAARGYMAALMGTTEVIPSAEEPAPEPVEIENSRDATRKMAEAVRTGDRERQKEITRAVSRLLQDPASEEVGALVQEIIADIDWNPRVMKRYLDVVRLLRNVQISFGEGDRADNPRLLVIRAAQMLLNWPQVVAWCQQQLLDPTALESWVPRDGTNHAVWQQTLEANIESQEMRDVLGAREFLAFLVKIRQTPPNVTDIFAAGVF